MTLIIDRDFTITSGQDGNQLLVRGEITAASGRDTYPVQFHGGSVTVPASASRVATVYVGEPNIAIDVEDTLTYATTLYVAGASDKATNNYAFWVDSGVSRFDGNLTVDGDLDFTGPQEISTSSGALTLSPANASLLFTGTIAVTGSRVTQSYHTNLTSTNAVTVDSSVTVKQDIEKYTRDAMAVVRGMDIVTYSHERWLDQSGKKKLGVLSESLSEPLALDEITHKDGSKYYGVNTYGLETILAKALQQIDERVSELERGK